MPRIGPLVCAAALLAGGCGNPRGDPAGRFDQVHDGACDAAAAAAGGDPAAALRRFEEIHGPLHELATAAQSRDRAAAARLLRAKQRVEAATEAGERAPSSSEFETLAAAVREAMAGAGEPSPRSCR